MKKAMIIGATGLIGSELLSLLLESKQYAEVKAITRKPLIREHSKYKNIVTDFDHLAKQEEEFAVDELFICLGTTMKQAKTKEEFYKVDYEYVVEAAKLAKQHGVEKVLAVSAIGADCDSLFYYNRVKGQMEDALRNMGLPSVIVFRPSLLLGEREEFRFGEKMGEWLYKGLGFAFIGKLKMMKPIHAKTVAKAMVKEAQNKDPLVITFQSDEIQEQGYY
ncbi:NAD(P)H-binding protein [Metabacillus idriensis]|uniref:NAD(P)H-binding protein n=1 Tax=Metabacillus idriensis TaxID=324768 RepID=UPI0017493ADA|nr:NAD(P)H-binding protein [Metabacillus idriensis]